jgi:NADH-quinone oxidoreductase subunit N
MFFDEPADATPINAPADMRVLLSMNGVAVAVLGLVPQALMSLCAYSLLGSL